MSKKERIVNDEVDLNSLFSVIFDNFNILFSIFLTSFLVISIYYLSATRFYQSNSLLEIKQNNSTSFLPESLNSFSSITSNDNSLDAEIEIYKSNDTVFDALETLKKTYDPEILPTVSEVKLNLLLKSNSKTLLSINFISDDEELSSIILNQLNKEFIKDRRDFIKQSSAAGKTLYKRKYLE